ncbi:MAG: aspartate carbamoyltransferase [Candidatus Peregrinibacteria bacterium]
MKELKHILTTKQFSKEELVALFEEAKIMESGGDDSMKGKIMATLFFEPSTRTRFSFETAMIRLGGGVISNADMVGTSSLKKMESLYDTGKVVSQMADVIVMRHPEAGSVAELSKGSDVPVINAGDGASEHPTQGLLDVYTIWKEKGGLDGLVVGMVGDLKYGRVPHSQYELLNKFDVKFIFVSPEELGMPSECNGDRVVDLESVIGEMDVIAMTRIQKERLDSEEVYKKYAGSYVLDGELMKKAKTDAIVMHPLPRVDEISREVDADPRAKYFEQVKNGVFVRMALLKNVLS